METWILIAWLYSLEVAGGGSGYSLATAATSLSVEFDSELACETAGTELVATEVPRTAPSLRFHYASDMAIHLRSERQQRWLSR
jgi:hypothetical protein